MLQRPEDLGNAGLVGMGGYEDMLDVFRLGGRGLAIDCSVSPSAGGFFHGMRPGQRTLILVAPLTDFSKELAIVLVVRQRRVLDGTDRLRQRTLRDSRVRNSNGNSNSSRLGSVVGRARKLMGL